jgi:hypothetical protein
MTALLPYTARHRTATRTVVEFLLAHNAEINAKATAARRCMRQLLRTTRMWRKRRASTGATNRPGRVPLAAL